MQIRLWTLLFILALGHLGVNGTTTYAGADILVDWAKSSSPDCFAVGLKHEGSYSP